MHDQERRVNEELDRSKKLAKGRLDRLADEAKTVSERSRRTIDRCRNLIAQIEELCKSPTK